MTSKYLKAVLPVMFCLVLLSVQAQSADTTTAVNATADTDLYKMRESKQKPDFIVSNAGDTLFGRYKKPVFGHSSFVVGGKKIQLDPRIYSAYQAKGILFRSVQVSNSTEPTWMECLEDGKIKLYQYIAYKANTRGNNPRSMPGSSTVWLAQKNGGPLLNVNGVMASEDIAKSNLHRLLIGQPKLTAELKSYPFNTNTVRGLIHAYNEQSKALK